ncbi:hypothetical protein HPB48_016647 [Haemaphysalis longicornis]|uniref:Uncharacterized protein n=1 Tax=Haemaphysalis longicornis TaxID=44386 RepID=A0A9J6GMY8_HAELO|nr:hypothetical protein HPB48_016647 [Haemaphysalis longicornis]
MEHLVTLLGNMRLARTLLHIMHTVYDLYSQTTQEEIAGFMGSLSCEVRIVYSTEVCLADEVIDLATATHGQSSNVRQVGRHLYTGEKF